ncbi:hypothetical protein RND71_029635 [Anisodus tanguticus]|uniref:U1-type domain-containing protein n=1 Tax=Anisodus tanguticus TaxID=243964 RepID=A0AAE1RG88_9SOLA|nr:hypothetical protein RND71_029635 [Anisodus tanguticus]
MAEDKRLENANAIQRELKYKQKIANLFPDYVLPLKEETMKLFESDGEINAIGTISTNNSNVKRQKASIIKNKKSARRIIDCSATTCTCTGVSQDTLKHLESHGESTIIKSNSSVNAEIPSSAPNASLLTNHFPRRNFIGELEHGEKIKNENGQQFWCELCQIPCMNEETFTLHCNGKKHRKHLYVFEEEKKKAEAKDSCHA